jgi:hypothetical protein
VQWNGKLVQVKSAIREAPGRLLDVKTKEDVLAKYQPTVAPRQTQMRVVTAQIQGRLALVELRIKPLEKKPANQRAFYYLFC